MVLVAVDLLMFASKISAAARGLGVGQVMARSAFAADLPRLLRGA